MVLPLKTVDSVLAVASEENKDNLCVHLTPPHRATEAGCPSPKSLAKIQAFVEGSSFLS